MRKRGLFSAGLILFLWAGLLAPAPNDFPKKTPGKEQPQRPIFYALQVVCEKDVQNSRDSLGAPDGRSAEILPGGGLVVLMEKKLYPFPSSPSPEGEGGLAESGSVVGKGGPDFILEGWFLVQDTQAKHRYVWVPLGLSAGGFCVGLEGSEGVNMIRITNPGNKSLFVDAVVGRGRETQGR